MGVGMTRTTWFFFFVAFVFLAGCSSSPDNEDASPGDAAPADAAPSKDVIVSSDAPSSGPAPTPRIFSIESASPMAPAAIHVRAIWGREDFPTELAVCQALPAAPLLADGGTTQSAQGDAIAACMSKLDDEVATRNEADLGQGTVLTARYQWDFGDPNGAHDHLEGWNAAHVYDAPGTYTIKLTVTNELGASTTAATSVTVAPDARSSIYVDAVAGSDTNAGTSPQTALKTLSGLSNKVNAIVKANTLGAGVWINFHAGQTFDFAWSLDLSSLPGTRIASYGTGTSPVLMSHGYALFSVTKPTAGDVIIDGVTLDTAQGAPLPLGLVVWGTNIVVRHVTSLHMGHLVECNWQTRGLYVYDSQSPTTDGLEGYFVWVDGRDLTIVGNKVANSTVEHDMRSSSGATDRVLVAENDLNRSPNGKVGTTINMRLFRYVYITQNTLHQGEISMPGDWGWPVGDGYQHSMWGVIERNKIGSYITLGHAGAHVMVRDNVLAPESGGTQNPRLQLLLTIEPVASWARPNLEDLHVINNTVVTTASDGVTFVTAGTTNPSSNPPPGAKTVDFANNLFVGPITYGLDSAAGMTWYHATTDAFVSRDHNVWPVGTATLGKLHYVGSSWMTLQDWNASGASDAQIAIAGLDANTFAPPASAVASQGSSARPGILVDFWGKPRSLQGHVTVGAVEE
jgi:PKD repeat protein